MKLSLKLGQIFWLVIPHFKEKLKPRPFLVYKVNDIDYIFLCITSKDRREKEDYIPQYLLINKPGGLYYEKSFIDLNIFVYIKHDLFLELLNRLGELKKQGQQILQEDFNEITKAPKIVLLMKNFVAIDMKWELSKTVNFSKLFYNSNFLSPKPTE